MYVPFSSAACSPHVSVSFCKKTTMSSVKGHEMSAKQLDCLWRYENFLAHHLLDLSLRQCSAVPLENWGTEMDSSEFLQLKSDIRKMWCRAGQYFQAFKCEGDAGWGLKPRSDLGKKLSITENSFTILGWLVRAPSINDCPTGHRYLRSPAFNDLYLGGPISLTNFSTTPTLVCSRATSEGPSKYKVYVRTVKPTDMDLELTWIYNLHLRTGPKEFFSIKEWQLDGCCSESRTLSAPISKAGLDRPTKKRKVVKSYMWCTYCGVNLEDSRCRVNRKEHWALHHSVKICQEINAAVDEIDPKDGVDPHAFKCHLETVDSVLRSLRDYNYTVLPACQFWKNARTDIPLDEDEKKDCFEKFLKEAKEAFRKYKVVYLCGLKFPQEFTDLLPVPETTYRDIVWLHNARPRSNQFAILNSLNPEQKELLSLKILTEFQSIVFNFSLEEEQ